MGISNVNNLNKIDLTKLNFGSKTVKTDNRPSYLKMTGSIFNAPGVSSNTNTLNDINTNKALNELRAKPSTAQKTSSKTTSNDKENADISSASEGKAAAASAEGKAKQVKTQKKQMESSEKTVNKYSEEAKKQQKATAAQDKKFKQTLKAQENELKNNNLKLQKVVKQNLETQNEITNAQNELDRLLGSSSFSIGGGNGASASGNNSGRIQELQTIIGSKSNLIQNNGKTIYSLQRSSSRTLAKMNTTNRNYVRTHKRNMKNVASTQTKAAKVAQTAQKFEQIAAMVSQLGQTVNLAGKGLVALGHASFIGAGVGAVLIATGQVMQKVGTVVEMTGNYGQTAASVTKGAAMAADGNLAGAMQAFGSAVSTGTAAINSTKNLKGTFGQIDKQAKEATKKLTANTLAKKKVEGMSKEELGGLSKKQMRKSISSQLYANADFDKKLEGNWAKKQFESYKEKMTGKVVGKDGKLTDQTFVSAAANKAKSTYATNTLKAAGLGDKYTVAADGTIRDAAGNETSLDKIKAAATNKKEAKAIKSAMRQSRSSTVSGFQNEAKEATKTKSTQKFDFAKFSQNLMTMGAMLMATNSNNMQGRRGYAPQWDLANDATFQKIYRSNRAHRATVA